VTQSLIAEALPTPNACMNALLYTLELCLQLTVAHGIQYSYKTPYNLACVLGMIHGIYILFNMLASKRHHNWKVHYSTGLRLHIEPPWSNLSHDLTPNDLVMT
jgi:hypothetical protein